jgi:phosphopantothenoylcysteine decarboxylase / phosphopantothenate---cysteine ligase
MSYLKQKKILLAITGSIAAYKSAELIRLLRSQEAQVKVVMTKDACEFISELTVQALSNQPVHIELLDPQAEASMSHITLAKWAEVLLIAPATANIMAKLAAGIADDLLTTLYLACAAPVIIVPAMNQQMWQHPATQENTTKLKARKNFIWGPDFGQQACGDTGPGRLLEPVDIVAHLEQIFSPKLFDGVKILITAGPTRESIDPVRYISNRSSGKMGYALASAVADMGAEVVLVTGPTQLTPPTDSKIIAIETAQDMYTAVMENIADCHLFIAAAAVSDYRCAEVPLQKMKKQATLEIKLEKNVDILAQVAALPDPPFTVGFAAETENLLTNAKEKLIKKKLDAIIVNDVSQRDSGFESDFNEVTLLTANEQINLSRTTKKQLAAKILQVIAGLYRCR